MVAVAVALLLLVSPAALADVSVGDRAPELDVAKTEAGKPFRIKSYRNQWLLVTFGASWCKPCKAELPAWDKMAPEFRGKVAFIAVNIDNDWQKGKRFNDKLGLRNMVRAYLPADKAAGDDSYETGVFPSTFVIDPKGVIRFVHKGFEKSDVGKMRSSLKGFIGS